MPGTTENCKCDHRQQQRVKPGDHRSADNFSVTHHLGDAESGQNDATHNVATKIGLVERKNTLEQRQTPLGVAWLLGLLDAGQVIPCGRPFRASSILAIAATSGSTAF